MKPYQNRAPLPQVFEVAMVCLFVEIPEKPGCYFKYTCRSKEPEVVDVAGALVSRITQRGVWPS